MARVRFLGAEPHIVPELGEREIQPDEIVTVPDDRFEGYICQSALWEGVEEPRTEQQLPVAKAKAAAKPPQKAGE